MKININEIARRAGVSIATVSRALNNSQAINKETQKKILEIAEEYNYKPNPIARSLSKQRTETVGVVLSDMNSEFFTEIIRGIDDEALRANYFLMVSTIQNQRNLNETFSEFMDSGRVDGIILMADMLHRDILSIIKKSEKPVILLNAAPVVGDYICFNINFFQGTMAVIDHLYDHGHRIISFIAGPQDIYRFDELLRGYETALRNHEIPIRENFMIKSRNSLQSGYNAFMRLAHYIEDIDAIFCANDLLAAGAYEAAQSLNIRIPQDVAIVGFDNQKFSQHMVPRLTTVHLPFYELGSKAMQYMLKMIDRNVPQKQRFKEELSPGLVIGGSCGWHEWSYRSGLQ